MRVLFIGGSGNISSACVELALRAGHQVTLLNRGREIIPQYPMLDAIVGDRNDPTVLQAAAAGSYDVVANFVGFTPSQMELDLATFTGKIGQYIFISSASVYLKPSRHYVITEDTPLGNPFWAYARDKIACEERLLCAHHEQGFPVTIVRPSYTFGPTWIPSGVGGHGYTIVHRMQQGLPIISHGDGQSLWVMTYHTDFAQGFCGLFGKTEAIGEAFHITSDEVLTWDQIYRTIAAEAGCEANLVHIPSDWIARNCPEWGPGLLGDKTYSVVFDNTKIKRLVPGYCASVSFAEGIRHSLAWHAAEPTRQLPNEEMNRRMDELVSKFSRI